MTEDKKNRVYSFLNQLEIPYEIVDHPPLFTEADNVKHRMNINAIIFKNLFLRNSDKSKYYLLSLPLVKRADLIKLRSILNESRLSFGDENALMEKLKIRPGSVSFLNAIDHPNTDVVFLVDNEIFNASRFGIHPNDNTSTVVFSPLAIPKIFECLGVKYSFLEL
ncbi:MAG: hypothetical protein LBE09_09555 [Christensenellaceae bacterium]|jgi:Ala-tRNA(Pro) deacylase|nr:hypothetical protein [Christensenellaceae bacterium]